MGTEKIIKKIQTIISNYCSNIDYNKHNCFLVPEKDVDFILLNSVYHKEIDFGKVDLDAFAKTLESSVKPKIIVMHHTLMNRFDDDRSALADAYEFCNLCSKNNVIAVLHGHTHGYSEMTIENDCKIVGVGALFSHWTSCSDQFNVISIQGTRLEKAINYRYESDRKCFHKQQSLFCNNKQKFEGNNISELYKQVCGAVKLLGGINELQVQCTSSKEELFEDLETNFNSFITQAEKWLAEETPDDIYYNHGHYMVYENHNGINYVIEELKRNSTSNRAIIPLLDFKTVIEKHSGYMPGLNSIQFGFKNDEKTELFCSMYLRSLEVNRFMPINLAEIYQLTKKICSSFKSVNTIHIFLYAFKAQWKEKFGCFQKAKLDVEDKAYFSKLYYRKNYNVLTQMIEEKFELGETVVNTIGLENLLIIFKLEKDNHPAVVLKLEKVIQKMRDIDVINKSSSDYHAIENDLKELSIFQNEFLEEWKKFVEKNESKGKSKNIKEDSFTLF